MKEHEDKFEEVVSKALEKGTTFELSHDFADRVVKRIQEKALVRESKRDRWWLIVGIVSMVIALIVAFAFVDFKPNVGVFTFFKGYSGLVIFGVLFIMGIHLLDKLLLKKQESG